MRWSNGLSHLCGQPLALLLRPFEYFGVGFVKNEARKNSLVAFGRFLFWMALSSVLLSGCAALNDQAAAPDEESQALDSKVAARPEPASEARQPEPGPPLDADAVFNALAGEVATHREHFPEAYAYLHRAAVATGDPQAAERAARIAVHLGEDENALEATRLWVRLAPRSLEARQLLVMLAMRQGESELAYEHLRAVVEVAREREGHGFLHAMGAVTGEKDYPAALELMQRLRGEFAEDAYAHYATALVAALDQEYALAAEAVDRALELAPNLAKAYILRSRILAGGGDTEAALQMLGEAVERFPQDHALRSTYARFLVDAEQVEAAYDQFLQLREQMPEDPDVHFNLGVLAVQLNRRDQAQDHFKVLVEMRKRQDEAAFYLGWIAEEDGRTQEALDWYERVEDGDFWVDAHSRMARLLASQGGLDRAREILQRLRNAIPGRAPQLYQLEAALLQEYASDEAVMTFYARALEEHPNDAELLYARAMFAVSIGRIEVLERDLRAVLAEQPDHSDALNALGYTLADQTDRYAEALGYIEKALALEPGSPAVLDSMGWVQFRMGNTELALKYLTQAYEKLTDPEIAAHYGEVLWVLGRRDEAEKVWREALEQAPDSDYLKQVMDRLLP